MDSFIILVINLQMAFKGMQSALYMSCLAVVALLVGMHIATSVKGYYYFVDVVEPEAIKDPTREITYKTYEARLVMGMAAAGITFISSVAAIALLNKPQHIHKLLNLVVFTLTIEVGIGLITMMSLYEMSITRDFVLSHLGPVPESVIQNIWDQNGFNLFWRLLIADAILTFVPQIAGLIFVYLGVSKEAGSSDRGDQLTNEGSNYNKF